MQVSGNSLYCVFVLNLRIYFLLVSLKLRNSLNPTFTIRRITIRNSMIKKYVFFFNLK